MASDDEWKVYTLEDLEAEAAADEAAYADGIAVMREAGWQPAPRYTGEEPLVWLHEDGSWGLSVAGEKPNPGLYWMENSRIRNMSKMLEWLHHLSEKTWFTAKHVRQMVGLYYKLHPESDSRPI